MGYGNGQRAENQEQNRRDWQPVTMEGKRISFLLVIPIHDNHYPTIFTSPVWALGRYTAGLFLP